MSEQKKPQAGEFWRHLPSNQISHVCGFGSDGHVICEANYDGVVVLEANTMDSFLMNFEHLPWCTSFDDVEPVAEAWPKWYVDSGMIYRRDDRDTLILVQRNGQEYKQAGTAELFDDISKSCAEITESEALARLNPPAPTCPDCNQPLTPGHAEECGEAWVVQDRVPARAKIDSCRPCGYIDTIWHNVHPNGNVVGRTPTSLLGQWEVRTRRKNLPPLPVTQPSTPDPGEGWRLIDIHFDVQHHADELFDQVSGKWVHRWNHPAMYDAACHYRRRITPAVHPLGPESSEPDTVPVRLIGRRSGDVRWQEIDESFSAHDVEILIVGNEFRVRKAVQE